MTILSVVQSVSTVIGIEIPDQVFPDQGRTMAEMKALINRVAPQIARAHDWTMLRRIETASGGGDAFPLPSDFDRMVRDVEFVGSDWIDRDIEHVNSVTDWLRLQDANATWGHRRHWTIMGGEIHVSPSVAANFRYGYITRNIVAGTASNLKPRFTNDADTFRLSEYLLELALICNWKAAKGDDYAEEMAAYSKAMEEEIAKDRGPGIVRQGRAGIRGVRPSYTNWVMT